MSKNISVVIPCYNAEAFLKETLESIFEQTITPREIILIDDGSTDASVEIAAGYGDRVCVIQQPNQGESVARNRGIDQACGEWIALLDADDLWEPTKLEKQIQIIERSPQEVVCVYTDFFYFTNNTRLETVSRESYHEHEDFLAKMLANATVHPSSALVRTSCAKTIRFPEETQHAEDMIFFANLRELGSFARIYEPLTGYRISSSNQSRMHGFSLASVQSRYAWFQSQRNRFSMDVSAQVSQLLLEKLIEAHDLAFWARDHKLVQSCRDYFKATFTDASVPDSFQWPLYPAPLLRLKDRIDRLWSKQTASPSH